MTEEEAKTKWCPMARTVYMEGTNASNANRDEDGCATHADMCLASGCMMWRVTSLVTRRGYCGLAGSVGLA